MSKESETEYAAAWDELTGYVRQAQEDGRGINADALMRYMTELKRRAVRNAINAVYQGEWPYARSAGCRLGDQAPVAEDG